MIEFPEYCRIKDRYCVCYFGPNEEFLLQLSLLKPVIEQTLTGIKLVIGCRDDMISLLNDNDALKLSDLKSRRLDFGHIRELRFNGKSHPIEDFLTESGLTELCIPVGSPSVTSKCVILTKATYPTVSLEKRYVDKLVKIATSEGFEPVFDQVVENAGLVMGVECYQLYLAASKGIDTRLVPTGIGTRLYKKMFPKAVVLHN